VHIRNEILSTVYSLSVFRVTHWDDENGILLYYSTIVFKYSYFGTINYYDNTSGTLTYNAIGPTYLFGNHYKDQHNG
jgi:hypothetical protein